MIPNFEDELKYIEYMASECVLCSDLYKSRIKPVFAKGDPNSDVMICGMCPGPEENEVGVPFVGAAGKVLDAIIDQALEEDVYITNLVKCFVKPGTPLEQEWMDACLAYFIVQINLVRPKVIIALGKDVCNFLLDNDLAIGKMRGQVYSYMKIPLLCTYHPSYLARGGGIEHKAFPTVVHDFIEAKKQTM